MEKAKLLLRLWIELHKNKLSKEVPEERLRLGAQIGGGRERVNALLSDIFKFSVMCPDSFF